MLLTRPPLYSHPEGAFSFDLHVLSAPPALILSRDQTLMYTCRVEVDSHPVATAGRPNQTHRQRRDSPCVQPDCQRSERLAGYPFREAIQTLASKPSFRPQDRHARPKPGDRSCFLRNLGTRKNLSADRSLQTPIQQSGLPTACEHCRQQSEYQRTIPAQPEIAFS